MDTSDSVSHSELSQFFSEVYGLLCQSLETEVDLYSIDFRPFFEKLNEADDQELPQLAIYLTDRYRAFRKSPNVLCSG